jgi:hypothetical protein
MSNLSGKSHGNLPGGGDPAESEAVRLVARARVMMMISALTTALAVAALVAVIGYRVFTFGSATATDGAITLPKGARVISTSASAGHVAVLFEIDGVSELRTFDIRTLKQTGHLRFSTEP